MILAFILLFANNINAKEKEGEYYFFTQEDIQNMKQSAQTDWGRRIMEHYTRSVENRLKHDMEVPTLEAGHGHFYCCPIHNVTFTFRWDKPTAHYCAACDKEWHGVNVYNWGWVNFVHANNLGFMSSCMYLYMITGDEKYAVYLRDMLLDYAGKYPDYMVHNVHRKQTEAFSGKMFGQSLDEAVWISTVARTYLAIKSFVNEKEARKIEKGLFQECANLLLRRKDGGNWQVWHNCALSALGIVLQNDSIINVALNDPKCGYYYLNNKHVNSDGWWNEGSPIYHFYPLGAMVMTAEAVRCRNINLYDERFYNMFASPVKGIYPDLFFPAHNDGWYGESLIAQANLYELAYARFKEPLFLDVLEHCYAETNRGGNYALLNPIEIKPATVPIRLESFRFEDSGFTVLRSDRATAVMKYGQHGGGHGHPDKLSISVHNGKKEILSDFGTSAYGAPDYNRWYRKTLSHNTVTVDGKDQQNVAGEFVNFVPMKNGGIIEAKADNVYPGVRMNRTVSLSGNTIKDRFTCISDEKHQYDYVLIFNERPVINAKEEKIDRWTTEPYRQIRNIVQLNVNKTFVINVEGSVIKIESSSPIEVFMGESSGIPPTNPGVKTKAGTEKRPVQTAYPVIIRSYDKNMTINSTWKIH